ncbi:MAG: ABC transporter substrate-binding protein [Deltaproteobacteria bacterium]|nr:ABC transporter substrate-binding protein [Deltaproteobacteria bacterium]MBM4298988.1 ABC transporter substrate-binding protein [Deltaproteobacteria bacterium]
MKTHIAPVVIIALLTIVAIGAVECRAGAAPSEVIISHASMSTSAIPLWVTQRQNFFNKYGVRSKLVWVRGNPAQIATLVSGDTQIAYGGAPTAIQAAVGGRDMKLVGSLSSRESLDLVARPNIKSPKEIAGKRFGVQSVGGGVWKTATVWLEHFGMDEKRDNIQMIVIGDVTVLAQSIEAGLIDVTVVPPFLSRRLAEKGFTILGRCEQTKLQSVGMTILVEAPYLQKNAETLQGVMMALIEGMAFTGHPRNKPAVLETLAKQFRLSDPAAAEGAYQDVTTLVRLEEGRKPYVSLEAMRTLQRLLASGNPKIGALKVESLIDSTVMKRIDDSGFFEKIAAEYGK